MRNLGWILGVWAWAAWAAGEGYPDWEKEVHGYWDTELGDAFRPFREAWESGRLRLNPEGETAFLRDLLKHLNIQENSQVLVFSTTSLQLRIISPRNPRAIYFKEDVYVGYIPGGRIEIISMDPRLGAIFYIFDIPRGGGQPVVERSERCMNCHASPGTGEVPGIALKSVLPGLRGGSMDSFRRDQVGHQVPYRERFGGWYVTGDGRFGAHWGNKVGSFVEGELLASQVKPGEAFDFSRYPVASSNLLPLLVLEHQAGFSNRLAAAIYRTREWLEEGGGKLPDRRRAELLAEARDLVRYVLFADEPPLPGAVEGGEAYARDFQQRGRKDAQGRSLREFDLGTRLFRYRCSYLVETEMFRRMPEPLRGEVWRVLDGALREDNGDAEFRYLPSGEKRVIRGLLAGLRQP